MGNLWKYLLRIERRSRRESVFRTIDGRVFVCDPSLAREVLRQTDSEFSAKPPFWRVEGAVVDQEKRKLLNQWTTRRLSEIDAAASSQAAVHIVLSRGGGLHEVCVHAALESMLAPLDFASRPELGRLVTRFYDEVFIPTILGRLRPRANRVAFKSLCISVGRVLADDGFRLLPPDALPQDADGGERYSTEYGELYLRSTAAFVASSSVSLAWLITYLNTDHLISARRAPEKLVRDSDSRDIALEVLRLWPPIWRLTRQSIDGGKIGGVKIVKGDQLQLPTFVLHRNTEDWADPLAFDPSRWTASPASASDLFSFSSGPLSCIGSRFAVRWLTGAVEELRETALSVDQTGRSPLVTTSFSPPPARVAKR